VEEEILQTAENTSNNARCVFRLSPSQQFPGRYDAEAEADLPELPPSNVFYRPEIRTQFYSTVDALRMHRIMQSPSIFNNPEAPVRLRIELNMNTEKAVSGVDPDMPCPCISWLA
jgi:hypothetical protein